MYTKPFSRALAAVLIAANAALAEMEPVSIRDGHFADFSGKPLRFWGVNLVSAFPEPEEADAFAGRLAALGVNLVRPHHLLRPSKDWIWKAPVNSLALYRDNSRDPDEEAWRRFDALNAALRRHGIRLALSLHFSRKFLPGDAAIIGAGTDDARAWADAIAELNALPWNKSIDPVKMLPAVDDRALALQVEFAKRLLLHRNPYTGLTYAEDPQVLTIEVVNESSGPYAVICGNRFPEYFERAIQTRWEKYAAKEGEVDPGDWRATATASLRALRTSFFQSLDQAHFKTMLKTVRDTGCRAAVTYSNLWRGEEALACNAGLGDFIEDHAYVDPRVADAPGDWMDAALSRTRLADRPFILGEFGDAEGERSVREQGHARTTLMLAAAAYGGYHAIDGIVWFAYCHGDRSLGYGGEAKSEGRAPSLGDMVSDGMLLDHMLPCSVIYRGGLVREAGKVATIASRLPAPAADYGSLMRGTAPAVPAGALSRQSVRKVFVRAGERMPSAPDWDMGEQAATNLFVTDTGELARDVARRQLTLSSPFAEAFSGKCAEAPARPFRHLDPAAFTGGAARGAGLDYATVVLAPLDGRPLAQSRRLIVSRTGLDASNTERCDPPRIVLSGLSVRQWRFRVARPAFAARTLRDLAGMETLELVADIDGSLRLPASIWTQATLEAAVSQKE
jgi:hypothetical protein